MSLYIKHRPKTFDEVVGQDAAVSQLRVVLKGKVPAAILFYGDTGTGKTTLARIMAKEMGVNPVENNPNFTEMNCADCRGIDDIRDINAQTGPSAWGGGYRIWILDEVIQLPTATQQAMLKLLEDPPPHIRFFLCSSNKTKLLPTIVGRCLPVKLNSIAEDSLVKLVHGIAKKEKVSLNEKVAQQIARRADGSARMALQYLEVVLTAKTPEDQLSALEAQTQDTMGFQLAQALFFGKRWSEVCSILKNLKQEPEAARHVIKSYCETILLSGTDNKKMIRAGFIISKLRSGFAEFGRPDLTEMCFKIIHERPT